MSTSVDRHGAGAHPGAHRLTRVDIVAGISVALVLIPQSLTYAELAGLPAYYGLYAAALPPPAAADHADRLLPAVWEGELATRRDRGPA